MFWKSMTAVEAEHIVAAFAFELGRVEVTDIRSAVVAQLVRIDHELATQVAAKLGLPAPPAEPVDDAVAASPALSQIRDGDTIESRRIAVLAADGVDVVGTQRFTELMTQYGAIVEVLAPVAGGTLRGGSGGELPVDRAFTTMASVLYDAVVPCGPDAMQTLSKDGYAMHFITEAYKHLKAIGAFGAGVQLLPKAGVTESLAQDTSVMVSRGVVTTTAAADDLNDEFFDAFTAELAKHRAWDRAADAVPA
jgi:catalase